MTCTQHLHCHLQYNMANFSGGFRAQHKASYNAASTQKTGHNPSGNTRGEDGQETRVAIRDVTPHEANTVLVGIVITKQRVHTFPDKRNPGSMRCKFTFTLRDSPADYINATYWGSEDHLRQLHSSFKICDVVEVQNCQVSSKITSGDPQNDKWSPWTPSQYQVNISETYSNLSLYSGWDYTEFTALAHVPLRPPSDYHTLSDILSNGPSMDGSHINILAIVKHVCAVREMTSKNGKPLRKCDIHLMDEGCSHFQLVMWDDEMIELAQSWTPRENIIFAVDVKVSNDSYCKCMLATCDQKTIVITNPDSGEAHQLYQYAQTVESDLFKEPAGEDKRTLFTEDANDNISSISQVYTVEELKNEMSTWVGDDSCFTGILFAYLTTLNIDQGLGSVLCHRCTKCSFRVGLDSSLCLNKACSLSSPMAEGSFSSDVHYNMLVSLTDCTGTVDSVLLTGQAAYSLLTCSPAEMLTKNERTRTEIKTGLVLEKFKVYFKCLCSQKKSSVRILSMCMVDSREVTLA